MPLIWYLLIAERIFRGGVYQVTSNGEPSVAKITLRKLSQRQQVNLRGNLILNDINVKKDEGSLMIINEKTEPATSFRISPSEARDSLYQVKHVGSKREEHYATAEEVIVEVESLLGIAIEV